MTRNRALAMAIGVIAVMSAVVSAATAGVGSVAPQDLGTSHGLRYVKGTSPIGFENAYISVACPTASAVVGGGVHVTGPARTSRISLTSPLGFDAWEADAQNRSTSTRTMSVYAVCRASATSNVQIASHGTGPIAGDVASAKARCPAGSGVMAGGLASPEQTNVSISAPFDGADADHVRDDGWQAKARHAGGFSGGLQVDAICLTTQNRLSYHSAAAKVRRHHGRTINANCPGTEAVTGGGMSIRGNAANRFIHSTRPRDSGADANSTPDDRWSATAFNGSNHKTKARAFAICFS